MNIVDSSGWLEYFAEGSNADFLPPPSKTPQIYFTCARHLYLRSLQEGASAKGENQAQIRIGDMKHGKVIEIDESLALSAARLSAELKLPMVNSCHSPCQ